MESSIVIDFQEPVIALAPLAGVSDSAFRQIAKGFGADLMWTEMVSATGLRYKRSKILRWLEQSNDERPYGLFCDTSYAELEETIGPKYPGEVDILRYVSAERPLIVQLFGKEPGDFEIAAELVSRMGFAGIDINMGCPARKVVNSFHGSSLMRDPELAMAIVRAARSGMERARRNDLSLSVKIRSGWDSVIAPQFSRQLEAAGVDFITVHSRTKEQGFRGRADWGVIKQVVDTVSLPVLGNGDVVDSASALAMLDETGCAGVMVGRAARGNPWVFSNIAEALGRESKPVSYGHFDDPVLDLAFEHCRVLDLSKGTSRGLREARKHLAWYIKGFHDAARFRTQLVRVENLSEVRNILTVIEHSQCLN